jgi:hypothetical protein
MIFNQKIIALPSQLFLVAAALSINISSSLADGRRCHVNERSGGFCISGGNISTEDLGRSGTNYTMHFSNSCNNAIDIYIGGKLAGGVPAASLMTFTCNSKEDAPNCPWRSGWGESCPERSDSSDKLQTQKKKAGDADSSYERTRGDLSREADEIERGRADSEALRQQCAASRFPCNMCKADRKVLPSHSGCSSVCDASAEACAAHDLKTARAARLRAEEYIKEREGELDRLDDESAERRRSNLSNTPSPSTPTPSYSSGARQPAPTLRYLPPPQPGVNRGGGVNCQGPGTCAVH